MLLLSGWSQPFCPENRTLIEQIGRIKIDSDGIVPASAEKRHVPATVSLSEFLEQVIYAGSGLIQCRHLKMDGERTPFLAETMR
jgi:hypothetical protein